MFTFTSTTKHDLTRQPGVGAHQPGQTGRLIPAFTRADAPWAAFLSERPHVALRRGVFQILLPVVACLLPLALRAADPPSKRLPRENRTFISASVAYLNFMEVLYPCLNDRTRDQRFSCGSKDYSKPHGPGYSLYHVGIEHTLHTSKPDILFLMGVNVRFEQYHNKEAGYHPLFYVIAPFVLMEERDYAGIGLGARVGDYYTSSNWSIREPIDLTARLWFGYKPWFTLQYFYRDHVVLGAGLSDFAIYLDVNAGNIIPKHLGRWRLGILENSLYRAAYHSDLQIHLGERLTIIPSVTYIPKMYSDEQTDWGLGIGARWGW